MYTGQDVFLDYGQISAFKGSTTIDPDIYPSYCGYLNGSAGDFFPPDIPKTYVDYFSPDLCRLETFFLSVTQPRH